MKPFFKWAGGKSKELPKIKYYLPKTIKTYYEPFVGGGAVWLNLNHSPSVINDKWWDIYNFYNQLKINQKEIVGRLQEIIEQYNLLYYDGITKQEFSDTAGNLYYYWRNTNFDNDVDKAIQFWILRQLSFSGMNRFNSNGEYNVPFGWYKRLRGIDWNLEFDNLFKNTTILNGDFEECVSNASEGDFVFIDPPYTTVFNKYSPNGTFLENDQIRLADWFKNSKSNNMIIINKDDFTENLYKDYIVEEYDYKYSIKVRDRISSKDSEIKHILAINYKSNTVETYNKFFK
jgi:DNA adenine methylase